MRARVVRAVRDLGVISGATGPHLVECDDGSTYVVKFWGESRVAINEYLGQSFAHELTLPSPKSVLVQITAEMASHSTDMRNRSVAPGLHQGSEFITGASDLRSLVERRGSLEDELVNWEVLPGVVCLDNWILTEDRGRPENHLLQAVPGGFRYYLVDFSHSFTGPNWTTDSLDQGSFVRVPVPVLSQVANAIRGVSPFDPYLGKIEEVADTTIEEIVTEIPPEWGASEEERSVLASFLERRRGLLRKIVESSRETFPNWQ